VRNETVTVLTETKTAQIFESSTAPSLPATQGALPVTPSVSETLSAASAGAIPLESDGEEIDAQPNAEIGVLKESSGKFLISLDSNIYEEQLLVRAFKKGSKLVIFKVSTNLDGRAAIRTNRNLAGFKLAVYVGDQFLDSVKI
jgi:hypothetical protein